MNFQRDFCGVVYLMSNIVRLSVNKQFEAFATPCTRDSQIIAETCWDLKPTVALG